MSVCSIFLLAQAPDVIVNAVFTLLVFFDAEFYAAVRSADWWAVILAAAKLLVILNSVVNFFIFLKTNEGFRKEVGKMFGRGSWRKWWRCGGDRKEEEEAVEKMKNKRREALGVLEGVKEVEDVEKMKRKMKEALGVLEGVAEEESVGVKKRPFSVSSIGSSTSSIGTLASSNVDSSTMELV